MLQLSQSYWKKMLRCWVFVPAGAFAIMGACFGVNQLLEMGHVSFPASVACLVILFLSLLLCDLVIGDRKTKEVVRLINIPVGSHLFRRVIGQGSIDAYIPNTLVLTYAYLPREDGLCGGSTCSSRPHS